MFQEVQILASGTKLPFVLQHGKGVQRFLLFSFLLLPLPATSRNKNGTSEPTGLGIIYNKATGARDHGIKTLYTT